MEIKYTYENKLKELLINSVFINATSLWIVFFSISSLMESNIEP
jgi:hypothetical protein